MSVFSIGLNHKTASLELRERFAAIVSDVSLANREIKEQAALDEILTISTCNRIEFYAVSSRENGRETLLSWIHSKGMPIDETTIYTYYEADVVEHLFKVVSSLDSMILGENQIVAQVRNAFQMAEAVASVGPVLRRIFEKAFAVAKKVRTQTKISEGAVSIGRAGVDLTRQVIGTFESKCAMVLGAGEHGQLIANNFKSQGLSRIYIANRTHSRAIEFANQLGGLPIQISEMTRYLHECDVVISSVGGGQLLITRKMVEQALSIRRYKPLVFIDLSVPRVFDTSIHDLDDAYLFDVDDLQSITTQGLDKRKEEAESASKIVHQEVEQCWRSLHADRHNQNVGEVFRNANEIVEQELVRLCSQIQCTPDDVELIRRAMQSVSRKVLHHPIQYANQLLKNQQDIEFKEYIETLIGNVGSDEEAE